MELRYDAWFGVCGGGAPTKPVAVYCCEYPQRPPFRRAEYLGGDWREAALVDDAILPEITDRWLVLDRHKHN